MSDLKYRTEKHLLNTISYEKRRMNTAKLRILACQEELYKRQDKVHSGAKPIDTVGQ